MRRAVDFGPHYAVMIAGPLITRYSGQKNEGLTEKLIAAGFTKARVIEKSRNFCALATKP